MVSPVKTAKNNAKSIGADTALRVGVIGAGVMGSNHARVFSELRPWRRCGLHRRADTSSP
jgi:ornithine cyclodeaminase/alanine dehydrogenase-like protein (mu-crystallin family)